MSKFRDRMMATLRPHGRLAFARSLKNQARVLDIGCGNEAVVAIKNVAPDCHYTGIDIADYHQTPRSKALMDRYVIADVDRFASAIEALGSGFDAVISSHNYEHCDDQPATLRAMMSCVAIGGSIYMSFPCEASVDFPSRGGTLNYYDDPTHQSTPPRYDAIISELKIGGFTIDFAVPHYHSPLMWAIGAVSEPISAARKRIMMGTWDFYGFEAVIHATRPA